jgi:hypothetical protein
VFDTRLTGPLTVTLSPNDEGHLSAAFGVSVGWFCRAFGSYALVGFDEVFTFGRVRVFWRGWGGLTTG